MPADRRVIHERGAAPSFVLLEGPPQDGARVALSPAESHYLTRVCRARPGDRATATDGAGWVGVLRVIEVGTRVTVEVVRAERVTPAREAHLLCGAPEGERADWLVEKLAELGVRVFQPVDCRRASWRRAPARVERWRRVAVAALRQSRRAWILDVREPLSLDAALAAIPEGAARWLCEPEGIEASSLDPGRAGTTVGLVGPAPGLDPTEGELARGRGFQPIRLAEARLRAETAAIAWAAWWASASAPACPTGPRTSRDEGGLDAAGDRP